MHGFLPSNDSGYVDFDPALPRPPTKRLRSDDTDSNSQQHAAHAHHHHQPHPHPHHQAHPSWPTPTPMSTFPAPAAPAGCPHCPALRNELESRDAHIRALLTQLAALRQENERLRGWQGVAGGEADVEVGGTGGFTLVQPDVSSSRVFVQPGALWPVGEDDYWEGY
ncbi:hypothetical protein HDU96_005866 [Phlyctochytrium bullatum]|nr:hypothetical protein HDU96_005866 [Phlyctochytrium bullatum]